MSEKYAPSMRWLHWIMAVLFIGMLIVGIWMADFSEGHPLRGQVYGLHKSIGVVLLGLIVMRLGARMRTSKPGYPASLKAWEIKLATITQHLMYVGMFMLPVSGWFMSDFADYPITVFNTWVMPSLVDKNIELSKLSRDIHGVAANGMIGLIGLHVVGFLKHWVLDKTNLLKRMV